MLEKIFKLKQNNTSVKTEVIAGLTTFMTMAYILAVNPNILSDGTHMDKEAILIATCLASLLVQCVWRLWQIFHLLYQQVLDLMHILHTQFVVKWDTHGR